MVVAVNENLTSESTPPAARRPQPHLPTIGMIGVGVMASALVHGIGDAAEKILLSPRGAENARLLSRRHAAVEVCPDNQAVMKGSEVVFLCVRPDQVNDALSGVIVPEDVVVVSVVAGVSAEHLATLLGDGVTVVRATVQVSVRRRAGLTVISHDHPTVRALFDLLGGTLILEEGPFDALQVPAAAMSSLLGYVKALTDWAVTRGVPPAAAERFVISLAQGAVADLDPADPIAEILSHHETPGGVNEFVRTHWLDERIDLLQEVLDQVLDNLKGPA